MRVMKDDLVGRRAGSSMYLPLSQLHGLRKQAVIGIKDGDRPERIWK